MKNEKYSNYFDKLFGKPCWNAKKGHGSFLTFEFGEPHVEIGKVFESSRIFGFTHKQRSAFVHGEWHLWIYMCDWSICYKDNEICHSESKDLEINRACGFLNGQSIIDAEIDHNTTTFRFDLGGLLKTIPYPDGEIEDTWLLYCPDKKVLSLQSDGQYIIENSAEPVCSADR